MSNKDQVEALERKAPKIFDVRNKFTIDSALVPEIKKWSNSVDYKFKDITVTQLASRTLEDGTIEAEFEIKKANAV